MFVLAARLSNVDICLTFVAEATVSPLRLSCSPTSLGPSVSGLETGGDFRRILTYVDITGKWKGYICYVNFILCTVMVLPWNTSKWQYLLRCLYVSSFSLSWYVSIAYDHDVMMFHDSLCQDVSSFSLSWYASITYVHDVSWFVMSECARVRFVMMSKYVIMRSMISLCCQHFWWSWFQYLQYNII